MCEPLKERLNFYSGSKGKCFWLMTVKPREWKCLLYTGCGKNAFLKWVVHVDVWKSTTTFFSLKSLKCNICEPHTHPTFCKTIHKILRETGEHKSTSSLWVTQYVKRQASVCKHPTAKERRTRDVGTLSSCGAYTEWQPTVVFHSLNPLLIISHILMWIMLLATSEAS